MLTTFDRLPQRRGGGSSTSGFRLTDTRVRWTLAAIALAVLIAGIGLSGGFRLAGPSVLSNAAATEAPVIFDNRGKWTGYAR